MNNIDDTVPMNTPPVSSSTDSQPQENLLRRGAFEPPFTPGTLGRLDRFEILRLQGEGGMGQVYLAREPRTDTRVAVKIMRPELAGDPQAVHRFLTEARHMYRLSHPRILRVLEVSERAEGPYYVMPFIEGGSLLGQYRPGKPLPAERALSIARQIAEALAHAHSHGLIHRDLKPGNVLLDKEGNAYLTDFGLVRTVFNDSMVDATASHLEGTAPYMSPAVARGEAEDTRCDIYAFGALLYELLAGQPPYAGRTPQIILDQVLKGPPPPLRSVNPKASPALVKIAEGCLARELHARYATMANVVADLDRIAKGEQPLGPRQQSQRRLPRLAALLVGTLAVAALAEVAVRHFSSAAQPRATVKGIEPTAYSLQPTAIPYTYTTNNGTITITKYIGTGGSVTIPSTINGLPVTGIGDNAFDGCTSLIGVTIPNSVTRIGTSAFMSCNGLTSVRIPASVVSMRGNPFICCSALLTIMVDEANPAYSSSADGVVFDKEKTKLVVYPAGKTGDYVIPANVTKIWTGAFLGCRGLTSVTIPTSVTSIEGWAFNKCTSLTSVMIPNSVIGIGIESFKNCTGLTRVFCKGNAPNGGLDTSIFENANNVTVFYLPGTTGWGNRFGGRPTAVWDQSAMDAGLLDDAPKCADDAAEPPAGTAQSQTAVAYGPFTYTLDNGAVTITKYTGPGGNVAIPSTINGHPVTSIAGNAFWGCTNAISVTIPTSVTSLGSNPFASHWSGMRSKLLSIVVDAANPAYCSTSDGVVFNKDKTCLVSYPGAKAGDYVIPMGVTSIGKFAFNSCHNLTSVTIPNSVTNIEGQAFRVCSDLTSVTIPASVASIGENPFAGCSRLTTVVVDAANPACLIADGVLFDKQKTRLIGCLACKVGSYVIPDSVASIDVCAFDKCSNLNSVTIPSGVTNIGDCAFYDCSSLTHFTIPGSITSIGSCVFVDCRGLTNITIPNSIISIGYAAFTGCAGLTSVYFQGNAPRGSSDGSVFAGADNATVYYRPGTKGWGPTFGGRPTAVWTDAPAAAGMPAAKTDGPFTYTVDNGAVTITKYTGPGGEVVIPKEINGLPVRVVGDSTFIYRGDVTQIRIPDSVARIADAAFFCCGGLTSIDIPKSVSSVGGGAFPFCERLNSITVDPANPDYCSTESGILFNKARTCLIRYPNGKTGAYAIPDSVRNIGDNAFGGRSKMSSVTIPNGVTNIGQFAFDSCSLLSSIVLPENIVSLGTGAFQCGGLKTIVIPKATVSIANYVFTDCRQLNTISVDEDNSAYCSVDGVLFNKARTRLISYPGGKGGSYQVPDGVDEINPAAFNGCAYLPSVTLPASVTRMGRDSFAKCGDLAAVYFNGNAPWADENMFADSKKVTVYYRPGTKGWGPTFGGRPTAVWQDAPGTSSQASALSLQPTASPPESSIHDFACVAEGGGVAIVKYTGKGGVVRIPAQVNGRLVKTIKEWAFQNCTTLTELVIPDSVTKIGNDAFSNCCSLKELAIGDGIHVIENGTFASCSNLTSVVIPNSVTNIEGNAFRNCIRLERVVIGDRVITIGENAFFGCSRLSHVEIPASVTSISAIEFSGCESLVSILVDVLNPAYSSSVEGVMFNKDKTYLYRYPYGKGGDYVIPDSVRDIGWASFRGCVKLTGVTIPNGVDTIAAEAFMGCSNLTSVTIPVSVNHIIPYAFAGCQKLTAIIVDAANRDYSSDSDGVVFSKDKTRLVRYPSGRRGAYKIPSFVTSIEAAAFEGCIGLTGITIPKGVITIETSTFKNCPNLVDVEMPDGVSSLGGMAFEGCSGLAQIKLPTQLTLLDGCVFRGCSSLTSVVIPDSVRCIDGEAFSGCTRLADIKFGKNTTNIAVQAFANCSALTRVTLPDNTVCVETALFRGCTNLLSVVLPITVVSIGDMAFDGCAGLTDITIPDSVTNIADCAFRGCASLTRITIPNGVQELKGHWGGGTFNGCSKLKHISLPDSVTAIGTGTFMGCTDLSTATIGCKVTNIASWAFGYCPRLTSIYLKGDAPGGGSDNSIFSGADKATVYYRPGTKGWGPTFGGRPTKEWKLD